MKKYALTLFGAALIAAAPAYYAFQAQAEDKPAASQDETVATPPADTGVAASASDTSNDKTVSDGSSPSDTAGSSRSPGSPAGESDVDASTSTDSVSE